MQNRSTLLALVDRAARDPSSARRLVELAAQMVDDELARGPTAAPEGYVYAGAHTFVAPFENVLPEPAPEADDPLTRPLHATTNSPFPLVVPFDCLIIGVSGWATPRIPSGLDASQMNAILYAGVNTDGRDLFSVGWCTEGGRNYQTDGRESLVEPAALIVGPRRNPRPLAWTPQRGTLINVYTRNLTNIAIPSLFYEGQTYAGWPLAISVEFHAVNLETP